MKLALIFGGHSFEHEISIVSAIALKDVLKHLDLEFIFISNDRKMFVIPSKNMKSNFFSSGAYKKSEEVFLNYDGFRIKSIFSKKTLDITCVLNLIHGGDGEDGLISSLLEFYKQDFIGPRVDACVLSFSKLLTKAYAKLVGVDTLSFKYFSKDSKPKKLDYPCILKPLRLGSSIGLSVLKNAKDLDYSVDVAREFDDEFIIEPFINNVKEYNLAGTFIENEFIFSIIEEPQKSGILDFEKKYLDFSRTEKTSKALIPLKLEKDLKDAFKKIYGTIFRGALIRCDFFVLENKVYLNEINPIPGSMSNYLFDDFADIISKLAKSLPRKKPINIDYAYVNKIQSAKGKSWQ